MDTQNNQTNFERGRVGAMTFGGLVYVGVVIAVSTLFISFVLSAFDTKAYFQRIVMTIAGVLIGGSMLAFPYALHKWAISGTHRTVTIGLYFGEMVIIAVNTLVSFGSMLAKFSGYILPEWVSMYEPFTILGAVYTLLAWGIVFITDPAAKSTEKELVAEQRFRERVANKKLEFLDTVEGEDAVMAVALADITDSFNPERFAKDKKHFGTGRKTTALADQLFANQSEAGVLPHVDGKTDHPLSTQ